MAKMTSAAPIRPSHISPFRGSPQKQGPRAARFVSASKSTQSDNPPPPPSLYLTQKNLIFQKKKKFKIWQRATTRCCVAAGHRPVLKFHFVVKKKKGSQTTTDSSAYLLKVDDFSTKMQRERERDAVSSWPFHLADLIRQIMRPLHSMQKQQPAATTSPTSSSPTSS